MIAVLYARKTSVYKTMEGLDVYDIDRDARKAPGGAPAIAHPPCRAWGRLRQFAKPREGERELAYHALEYVRTWGGILEHPQASRLWIEAGLPGPQKGKDAFGGWTLSVPQYWWGHEGYKSTRLYIVGIEPRELPPVPFVMGEPERKVEDLCSAKREKTPPDFARWLVEVAKKIQQNRLALSGKQDKVKA